MTKFKNDDYFNALENYFRRLSGLPVVEQPKKRIGNPAFLEYLKLHRRLYIHRVEPIEKDKKVVYEEVPLRPDDHNLGVEYTLFVDSFNEITARVFGWHTGYPMSDDDCYLPSGRYGTVYAPKGFAKGELIFAKIGDWMISETKFPTSFFKELFLENLEEAEEEMNIALLIDKIRGFDLVGRII